MKFAGYRKFAIIVLAFVALGVGLWICHDKESLIGLFGSYAVAVVAAAALYFRANVQAKDGAPAVPPAPGATP